MNVIKSSCGAFYAIPIYKGTHICCERRTDYSLTGCCTCTSRNSQLTWNLAPWPGASIWWHHTSQNHSHPTPFRGKAQAQVSSNIDVYVYLKIIIIVLYASTGSSLLPNSMRSKWANFPHTKSNTPDQGATLAVLCWVKKNHTDECDSLSLLPVNFALEGLFDYFDS